MLKAVVTEVGGEDRTILMTTHNLERGLSLGNRVVILANGKIAYDVNRAEVSLDEVRAQYFRYVN